MKSAANCWMVCGKVAENMSVFRLPGRGIRYKNYYFKVSRFKNRNSVFVIKDLYKNDFTYVTGSELLHDGSKAHIEHAIGFIKDEVL